MPRVPFSMYQRRLHARTQINIPHSHRWNILTHSHYPLYNPPTMNPQHPSPSIQVFPAMIEDNTLYASMAPPPNHNPHSWVEMSLMGHTLSFSIEIEGRETLVMIRNLTFLAQLVSKDMHLAMDNYNHHL